MRIFLFAKTVHFSPIGTVEKLLFFRTGFVQECSVDGDDSVRVHQKGFCRRQIRQHTISSSSSSQQRLCNYSFLTVWFQPLCNSSNILPLCRLLSLMPPRLLSSLFVSLFLISLLCVAYTTTNLFLYSVSVLLLDRRFLTLPLLDLCESIFDILRSACSCTCKAFKRFHLPQFLTPLSSCLLGFFLYLYNFL